MRRARSSASCAVERTPESSSRSIGSFLVLVKPFAAPDGIGGVTGGLLRRSEVVQPVVDQRPGLVEQNQCLGGVVAPVERVAAAEVVVWAA